MIRFTQPQSVIEFANNPVVIMSIIDNDVTLSVRVKADPNYVIKVRVSELRDDTDGVRYASRASAAYDNANTALVMESTLEHLRRLVIFRVKNLDLHLSQ
jgi:hypothetical protein